MEPNFDSEEMFRGNGDEFRRSFNLDGMINLSGQGKRLAVLRVSDDDTDKTLGRMQARFTDAVRIIKTFEDLSKMNALYHWSKTL